MKKFFILLVLTAMAIYSWVVFKVNEKKLSQIKFMSGKHLSLFLLMNRWVRIKQEGKCLSEYFEKKGYKKIAIYGMSYIGETLNNELKNTKVIVAYGIDKKLNLSHTSVNVVSLDDHWDKVDAIVVTAITFFDEIAEQLSEKVDYPIISLEDILYEV